MKQVLLITIKHLQLQETHLLFLLNYKLVTKYNLIMLMVQVTEFIVLPLM